MSEVIVAIWFLIGLSFVIYTQICKDNNLKLWREFYSSLSKLEQDVLTRYWNLFIILGIMIGPLHICLYLWPDNKNETQ